MNCPPSLTLHFPDEEVKRRLAWSRCQPPAGMIPYRTGPESVLGDGQPQPSVVNDPWAVLVDAIQTRASRCWAVRSMIVSSLVAGL